MATFIGQVKKTTYDQYYQHVRSNPGDFVARVLGQKASGPEPSGRFQIGEEIFTLKLVTKGKTRRLCIERQFENGESLVQTRIRQLMDYLFFRSSTRRMERALRSGSTITAGLVKGLRGHADRVVEELWPGFEAPLAEAGAAERRGQAAASNRRPISERALGTLVSLNPGEIDAWIRCPEEGPVSLEQIDRGKSRIEDDILVLSFKSGGDAIEFRLHARGSGSPERKQRARRDMERLLSIARGDREDCGYRNMAELMGRFMVATIEDEAPRLLEQWARGILSDNENHEVRPLLICTVKKDGSPESTRATRRALARAVDEAMASCRACAAQRFQAILNGVCRDKADRIVSAVLDARASLIEAIQQKAKPFVAGQRLAAFVRQVVQERGVSAAAAQALHDDRPAGAALPEGVRLARFTRKPGLLDWISGERTHEEVLAVASRKDGEALRFVPQGRPSLAKWAWKTIRLAEVPKHIEGDAKALHQTVFDVSLGQFYQREIVPLLHDSVRRLQSQFAFEWKAEEDVPTELLLRLTSSLRIGNTTCGYLHRWAGEAAGAGGAGGPSAERVVVADEIEVVSGPIAEQPISPQQAAAYVLRQELKSVVPPVATVAETDCEKPVTVYTDGKFESLHQFDLDAPRKPNDRPQRHPVDKGKSPNPEQPAASPSSTSSTSSTPSTSSTSSTASTPATSATPATVPPSAPPLPERVPAGQTAPV